MASRRPPPARHTYTHAGGIRPITPASTADTAFVGVLRLSQAVLQIGDRAVSAYIASPDAPEPLRLGWADIDARGLGPAGVYPVPSQTIERAVQAQNHPIRSAEELVTWRQDVAREIIQHVLSAIDPENQNLQYRAEDLWEELPARARRDATRWLRQLAGMRYLELALHGFFENGGRVAHIVLGVLGADSSALPRDTLSAGLDRNLKVAMLCAPGLSPAWQHAILDYAGPKGRGDLFAIIDGPIEYPVVPEQGEPFAAAPLLTRARPQPSRVVHANDLDGGTIHDHGGFGAAFGPWLYVDNPLSAHTEERYVLCPPCGHIAGAIAGLDLTAEGGVQQPLSRVSIRGVADIQYALTEDQLQHLFAQGINPLAYAPRFGLRVAGERTLATDTTWMRLQSRRAWLSVARSLREGLQWAVQSSSPDRIEAMDATINVFLEQQYRRGVLEGERAEDAWSIEREEPDEFSVWIRPVGLSERVQVIVHTLL